MVIVFIVKFIRIGVLIAALMALGACATFDPIQACQAQIAEYGVDLDMPPDTRGYWTDTVMSVEVWEARDARPRVECTHWGGRVREIRLGDDIKLLS